MDFEQMLSRRAREGGDPELAIILAGPPPGVLAMTGGLPNAATFPSEELAEIAARLVRDEPGLALQYTPSEGIRSVREYMVDRVEHLQGRRPAWEGLTVTSGGLECIDLICRSLLGRGRDGHLRLRGAARGRLPPEAPLHDPGVPEPERADADARAPPRPRRGLP